jgi:hypothetical protein
VGVAARRERLKSIMTQRDGTNMLEEIRAIWEVKPGDFQPIDGGFHWWPGHHKVTVRCLPKSTPGDDPAWRLSVVTEYLQGLDLEATESLTHIVGMGAYAPTYGWAFMPPQVSNEHKIPVDGSVNLHSVTYVRPDTTQWLPRVFAQLAIMQAIDAQRTADSFGGMLKGAANKSGPRFERRSDEFAGILNVAKLVLAPAGQGPSRWTDSAEFGDVLQRLRNADSCAGGLRPGGLVLEVPFGTDSALLGLRHDIAHPALGSGLLGTIRLPLLQTQSECALASMWLNYLATSSWTDAPVHGTWHPQEVNQQSFCPAYALFIPNALHAAGLALNVALWNIAMVRWARRAMWPQLKDKTMPEILDARRESMIASGDRLW